MVVLFQWNKRVDQPVAAAAPFKLPQLKAPKIAPEAHLRGELAHVKWVLTPSVIAKVVLREAIQQILVA
ncbi:MAG: hypothetical protein KGJ32_02055 [Xanthomonadaceae bacterium]|nr:hypothetical protein [Xanthomonadaceae bacterium]